MSRLELIDALARAIAENGASSSPRQRRRRESFAIRRATSGGWPILPVLARQYVDGHNTDRKPPAVEGMVRFHAPASDGNHLPGDARLEAAYLGARPEHRRIELVSA